MFKCFDCDSLLDYEDLKYEKDRDTLERRRYCPHCGSDNIDEVVSCSECGEYYPEGDLFGMNSVCEDCIMKMRYDLDFCAAVGDEVQEEVSLNGFLLEMFSEEEIEAILMRELKAASETSPVDGGSFLTWNLEDAADVLKTY